MHEKVAQQAIRRCANQSREKQDLGGLTLSVRTPFEQLCGRMSDFQASCRGFEEGVPPYCRPQFRVL